MPPPQRTVSTLSPQALSTPGRDARASPADSPSPAQPVSGRRSRPRQPPAAPSGGGGGVCEAAMSFIGLLDVASLEDLQREMGGRCVTRAQLRALLASTIAAQQRQRDAAGATDDAVTPMRRVAQPDDSTGGSDTTPAAAARRSRVRSSDADFRAMLRRMTVVSDDDLDAVVASVDWRGSDRIRFSDFTDFLVAAGRRAAAATAGDAVGTAAHNGASPLAKPDDVVEAEAADSASPARLAEYALAERRSLRTAPYVALAAAPDAPAPCFLAATLRWVDVLGADGRPLAGTRQIAPPQDPRATIACVAFVRDVSEVAVGFHHSKLMFFAFPGGQLQREIVLAGVPSRILAVPTALCPAATLAPGVEGLVVVGTECGSLHRVTLMRGGGARVASSVKIGQAARVAQLDLAAPLGSVVVGSCGRVLFTADAALSLSSLRQRPFLASSPVTAVLFHAPTASVVCAVAASPGALFVFPRRALVGPALVEPHEVCCASATGGSLVVSLFADPFCSSHIFSAAQNGTIHRWNITKRTAASCRPVTDGPESALVAQCAASHPLLFAAAVVAPPTMRAAVVGGKGGIALLERCDAVRESDALVASAAAAAAAAVEERRERAAASRYDPPLATLALNASNVAFSNPSHCLLCVYPGALVVHDVVAGATRCELPIVPPAFFATAEPKINPDARGRLPAARPSSSAVAVPTTTPLRVRCATLGPGQTVLLGTECGTVLLLSIEASSIGDCDVLARNFLPCEAVAIFFAQQLSVVGVVGFDGHLVTAELAAQRDRLLFPVTATAVHHCDALAFDSAANRCAIVDLEERSVSVFAVTLTGTRLSVVARLSLYGSPVLCAKPSGARVVFVQQSAAEKRGRVLFPTLADDEPEISDRESALSASRLVVVTTSAAEEESVVSVLELVSGGSALAAQQAPARPDSVVSDASDLGCSFLTGVVAEQRSQVQRAAAASSVFSPSSQRLSVVAAERVVGKRTVTALCGPCDDDGANAFIGLSDGRAVIVDAVGATMREIPVVAARSRRDDAAATAVVLNPEPIAFVAEMPGVRNVAVCTHEDRRPHLLFRQRSSGPAILATPMAAARASDATPLTPSALAALRADGGSTARARGRSLPALAPRSSSADRGGSGAGAGALALRASRSPAFVRSGSALERSGTTMLDVLGTTTQRRENSASRAAGLFSLPPLAVKRK